MKFIRTFLAAIGLNGCAKEAPSSKQPDPTPAAFTSQYSQALRAARPELPVTIKADLELAIQKPDGEPLQLFLDNAFAAARQPGADIEEIISRYVKSALETVDYKAEVTDTSRIIPIIKDRAWLDEVKLALGGKGNQKAPEHVTEEFCGELVIVYAEDTDENIRYLIPDTLQEANLEASGLRKLAASNLQKLLPPIETHGGNGLYMITAGGNYEASLLLLDDFWSGSNLKVTGEIVVCVPARDMLLVTGSEDSAGLEKLRQIAAQTIAGGGYTLTTSLFVWRDGKFQPFEQRPAK